MQGDAFEVVSCMKDNTGEQRYIEKECFPSLQFPSDHGLVVAVFRPIKSQEVSEIAPTKQLQDGSAQLEEGNAINSLQEEMDVEPIEQTHDTEKSIDAAEIEEQEDEMQMLIDERQHFADNVDLDVEEDHSNFHADVADQERSTRMDE